MISFLNSLKYSYLFPLSITQGKCQINTNYKFRWKYILKQVFQNNDISVGTVFAIQPLAVVQHQALHQQGIVTAEYLPNRTEMIIQQLQGRPRPVSYCQLLEVSGTWR